MARSTATSGRRHALEWPSNEKGRELLVRRREVVMVIEAVAWVAAPVLLSLVLSKTTDSPIPMAVFISLGAAMALGTLVEIWIPGPLTGKRHPKVSRQGPRP